jgi:hypothetical protein
MGPDRCIRHSGLRLSAKVSVLVWFSEALAIETSSRQP